MVAEPDAGCGEDVDPKSPYWEGLQVGEGISAELELDTSEGRLRHDGVFRAGRRHRGLIQLLEGRDETRCVACSRRTGTRGQRCASRKGQGRKMDGPSKGRDGKRR